MAGDNPFPSYTPMHATSYSAPVDSHDEPRLGACSPFPGSFDDFCQGFLLVDIDEAKWRDVLLGLERSELMSGCICELSDYGDYQESF